MAHESENIVIDEQEKYTKAAASLSKKKKTKKTAKAENYRCGLVV